MTASRGFSANIAFGQTRQVVLIFSGDLESRPGLTRGRLLSPQERAKVPKGRKISRREFGNFRLAAKTLRFDYILPWRIVERRAAAAPRDNMLTTWDAIRTYFQNNFYPTPQKK